MKEALRVERARSMNEFENNMMGGVKELKRRSSLCGRERGGRCFSKRM